MMILNLTQHNPTPEQVEAGVINLRPHVQEIVGGYLTFETLPTDEEIEQRASLLACTAMTAGATHAMIGGAPFLMGPLEAALRKVGIQPMYAFSKRESVETVEADGSVRKTAVFRHVGFVEA